MLKKTIEFEDYNGLQITEDFYFNLTKAELVELQMSSKDGFAETLQKIIASSDGQQIIDHFKKIILMAYGVKSDDGRRFVKTQELRDEFSQTEAYSTLFIELATSSDAAAAFINGVIPTGMAQEAQEAQENVVELPTAVPQLEESDKTDTRPPWIRENREPTTHELLTMDKAQIVEAMNHKNKT